MYYFGWVRGRSGLVHSQRYDKDITGTPDGLVGDEYLLTDRQALESLKSLEKKFPYIPPKEDNDTSPSG